MDGILTLAVPVDDQIERVARLADQRDKLLAAAVRVGCMVVIYQRQIALRRQCTGVLVRDSDGIHKVTILENVRDFGAGQQILAILGQARGNPTPFAETLPDFYAIGCGLLFF